MSLAPVGFSCRLPVSGAGDARVGFVSFPDATFAGDTPPEPTISPNLGSSFDPQLRRWLSVPPQAVSPDGARYAFTTYRFDGQAVASDGLHVVDAVTGRDLRVAAHRAPPAPPWFVVAYRSEGLYVSGRLGWADGHPSTDPSGLYLLDPVTGAVRVLDPTDQWFFVSDAGAFGVAQRLGVRLAASGSALIHLDLATGAVSTWAKRAEDFQLVGMSRTGKPIIQTASGLERIDAPGQVATLVSSGVVPEIGEAGNVHEDSHGLWISPESPELWLWTAGVGSRLVFRFDDQATRKVAGDCV